MKTNRRDFIKIAGMAGLSLSIPGCKYFAPDTSSENQNNKIMFIGPVDGDMLNENSGTVTGESLSTRIKIMAPEGSRIRVNGMKAKYVDGIFQSEITLKDYENVIELEERKTGFKEKITVFWVKKCINNYRFAFNANIRFLQELTVNEKKYKSIFDNPYLACIKKVHDTLGTKVHFNLFYQTVEGDFNLSQMTDKYKNEWKQNADWLELSFSATADKPDKPYQNAGYDQVKTECLRVHEQIKRFAGEELIAKETTLHWGEATPEGCRAVRDCGYKILAGYFNVDDDKAPVSYYLTVEQRRNVKKRFIWRDNKEGIIFARLALVINTVKHEEIVPYLDQVKKTYNPGHIDLMIHEYYFYPDYELFQPDWCEKVMTAAKWAADNGYKPGFIKDVALP